MSCGRNRAELTVLFPSPGARLRAPGLHPRGSHTRPGACKREKTTASRGLIMNSGREVFLQRVRRALSAAARPGRGGLLPERGAVGYQGAGGDPVERFCTELTAAGGHAHRVTDSVSAAARVLELVRSKSVRRALVGRGPFLDPRTLPERVRGQGIEPAVVDQLDATNAREPFFAADVGISGVDYLIAETGTVVLLARPEEPRSLSLLPPIHLAVADRGQIVPDLFDL